MCLGDLKQMFYYFPLRWLARVCPVKLVEILGKGCGWLEMKTVRPATMRRLRTNLAKTLHLPPESEKIRDLSRKVITHYLWNILEYCLAHHLRRRLGTGFFQFRGLDCIDRAIEEGRGVVVVSGHLVTFELIPTVLVWRRYETALITPKESRLEQIPRGIPYIIQKFRKRYQQRYLGYQTIHTGMAFRTAISLLKRGGIVGIAIDYPSPTGSMTMGFLGRPVRVPMGPAYLAVKTQAKVVLVQLERLSFAQNRFVVTPLPIPRTGNERADMRILTVKLATMFEQFIMQHPEQWAWQMWHQIE